jgi:hypothetical protein
MAGGSSRAGSVLVSAAIAVLFIVLYLSTRHSQEEEKRPIQSNTDLSSAFDAYIATSTAPMYTENDDRREETEEGDRGEEKDEKDEKEETEEERMEWVDANGIVSRKCDDSAGKRAEGGSEITHHISTSQLSRSLSLSLSLLPMLIYISLYLSSRSIFNTEETEEERFHVRTYRLWCPLSLPPSTTPLAL